VHAAWRWMPDIPTHTDRPTPWSKLLEPVVWQGGPIPKRARRGVKTLVASTQLGVILSFGLVRVSPRRTTERLTYAPTGACPRGAQDSQANRDHLLIFDPHELVSWVKQIQLLSRFHLTPKRSPVDAYRGTHIANKPPPQRGCCLGSGWGEVALFERPVSTSAPVSIPSRRPHSRSIPFARILWRDAGSGRANEKEREWNRVRMGPSF
jgi:hypothetical protein